MHLPTQDVLFPDAIKRKGPNNLSVSERQTLVAGCEKWCRKLARDHAAEQGRIGRRCDVEELEGEAFLACCESAKYFDVNAGFKFITFSGTWVRTHLMAYSDPRKSVPTVGLENECFITNRDDGETEPITFEPANEAARYLENFAGVTRDVVQLSVCGQLTPDQIAVQLGMKVKDVHLHIRNALARLTRASKSDAAAKRMIDLGGEA